MIIDASIWVASVIETDAHHAISLAFLRRFVTEQQIAVVPLLALASTSTDLAARLRLRPGRVSAIPQVVTIP